MSCGSKVLLIYDEIDANNRVVALQQVGRQHGLSQDDQ
jgi:hypothetical protein